MNSDLVELKATVKVSWRDTVLLFREKVTAFERFSFRRRTRRVSKKTASIKRAVAHELCACSCGGATLVYLEGILVGNYPQELGHEDQAFTGEKVRLPSRKWLESWWKERVSWIILQIRMTFIVQQKRQQKRNQTSQRRSLALLVGYLRLKYLFFKRSSKVVFEEFQSLKKIRVNVFKSYCNKGDIPWYLT